MSDILKVQGRMTMGYGIIPKMVMQDKRLTIEAKAIYAYFCSYAGAGTTAFPSRDKIIKDLQLGVKRYYNHLNLLKDYGYIEVEQKIDSNGKFKRNIYTLVEMIDVSEPCSQNDHTENPCSRFAYTDEAYADNDHNNNNILKNNNSYNEQSESSQSQIGHVTPTVDIEEQKIVKDAKKEGTTHSTTHHGKHTENPSNSIDNDYTIYTELVKNNIDYAGLIHSHPYEQDTIDELINCMLDVICTKSDTIKINGEKKSRSLVKSVFLKINSQDIDHILDRFKDQRHKVTHVHSYLKTMLYTVKQEISHYYTNIVRVDGVV